MKELSRAGQQALKSQPFSALIGARLTSLSEGKAVLEVPIREELLQQNGCVAGGSVLGPVVLTSEYKINYLRLLQRGDARGAGVGGRRRKEAVRVPLGILRHWRG